MIRTQHPALEFRAVSKTFGTTRALSNVSFDVPSGRVHALCGGNGSGKSSLIRILAGVETADTGTVTVGGVEHQLTDPSPQWARESGLRFVHQDLGLFLELSVAENIAMTARYPTNRAKTISWRQVHRRTADVLERWKISARPSDIMSTLGPAVRAMITIARALSAEDATSGDNEMTGHGRTLILDEPTSALPEAEVDRLLTWVRRTTEQGNTVIIVTHRLDEILTVADSITVLRDGDHVVTRSREGLTHRDLVTYIAPTALEVQEKTAPLGNDDTSPVRAPKTAEPRLQVRHLSGGSLRDVSFTVYPGEIVGIAGLLGSGRTRLLKYLAGALRPDSGVIELDGNAIETWPGHPALRAGVVLIPENRADDGLFPGLNIAENLEAGSLAVQSPLRIDIAGRLRSRAKNKVRQFGVKVGSVSDDILTLSGGNQQKVLMARWLSRSPRLILLDEPTVGVDIGARNALHGIVREATNAGSAAVCVTSDLDELCELCDRIQVLHQGVLSEPISGEAISASAIGHAVYGALDVHS
ncbi:monosaccharide ABC transporter ATP-binding protein (CUT2 family) [Antricoccus suffuscus]|uniref:Monosaccharide ABC transporter ATP-binding protein (CUT2 family) n=1 Tax=Antricoccus suffuscus TaxID=1629062 RepID=A0A2T0ZEL7_9ACTN|nr:sugar ABC transporter ATP-binding protein [Antricoccus suffuscus]PRZ34777.1 monosaccharide ABC transporter ATP-binding protein (CUT2 family) [Antricoccus suffuscus]